MLLSFYSIFLLVGSEVVQVVALTPIIYVKGFTLMHILLNVAMWIVNTSFWVDSTEFQSNDFQKKAMTIEQWQLVTVWPNFIFLFFLWLFLIDIDNYYLNFDSEFKTTWQTVILSVYSTWLELFLNNAFNEFNAWYQFVYKDTYKTLTVYLNPI